MPKWIAIALVALLPSIAAAGPAPALGASQEPSREVYTTNRLFVIHLTSAPQPIPFERHFALGFTVSRSDHPAQRLKDATVTVAAGMRHGLKHGFAHGMESRPQLVDDAGQFTIKGLFFHMRGPWTVQLDIREGAKHGVAYLDLPCCGG
jgi:hypothetical protein